MFGQNGIITKAQEAVRKTDIEATKEQLQMDLIAEIIEKGDSIEKADINSILAKHTSGGTAEIVGYKIEFSNLKTNKGYAFELDAVTIFGIGSNVEEAPDSIKQLLAAGEVNEGEYVLYEPGGTVFNWSTENKNYSGGNNTGTVVKDNTLKWKILDSNGPNGAVRLISDKPTGSVSLGEAGGYNNAVLLLNTICDTIYSNSLGIARNIKVEDITDHITGFNTDPTAKIIAWGNSTYKTSINTTAANSISKYYPAIAHYEEGNQGFTDWGGAGIDYEPSLYSMKQSEQDTFYGGMSSTGILNVIITAWSRNTTTSDFESTLYHDLFMGASRDYNYWLATRSVDVGTYVDYYGGGYCVRTIQGGWLNQNFLISSCR